jgi:hypothetical protein
MKQEWRQYMRVGWILQPAVVVIASVLASFAFWLIPGESEDLRGFDSRSAFGGPGTLLLFGWYVVCITIIWFAVKAGRRVRTFEKLDAFQHSPTLERSFYWFLSSLATIGVLYCFIVVATSVDVVDAITNRNFNVMAHALPDNAGLSTLRYTTAIAAPIGVFLWQQKKSSLWLALWNVILLLSIVALASRLSLILAVVVYAFLFVSTKKDFRLKAWVAVVAIVVVFVGLTAFNYARNANYYEDREVTNPLSMNMYQTAAYVGTPFQVSLGVANAIVSGERAIAGEPAASTQAIAPTFIDFKKSYLGGPTGNSIYGDSVSVAKNLTTNSAFADTYVRYGWWGLAYTTLILAAAGFGFGALSRYRSVVAVFSAILLYGFAEYWRIFLFNQGILIYLLLASASAITFALLLPTIVRWWQTTVTKRGKSTHHRADTDPVPLADR